MVELWSKECWGEWTLIDPDTLEPHNVVRHVAKNHQIGLFKTDAVKEMAEANYAPLHYPVTSIPDSAVNLGNKKVRSAITAADFIVDASTTLEVPRTLSNGDETTRSVSVFIAPSGNASVLLLEDSDRSLRLDILEAQYYRAALSSAWGDKHFADPGKNLWVGMGCRDVSLMMSNEIVQFHAALLARQTRLLRDRPEACIKVWSADPETGAVEAFNIEVKAATKEKIESWSVVVDEGTKKKLYEVRQQHLPKETGGVVLGYIDQKLRTIYVVDVLEAPPDSEADESGFIRGVEGLKEQLERVSRRTAGVVGYLGEWHSHPTFHSAHVSSQDEEVIQYLKETLSQDGLPAVMVIVGSAGEITISVREK
ncbi:MAG: Mov34/MPN/PAD-1 family protein [Thermodesulfovibrionales bacterium]